MKSHKWILTTKPRSVFLPPEDRNAASHLVQKQPAPRMDLTGTLRPCGSPHIVLGLGFGTKSRGNSATYWTSSPTSYQCSEAISQPDADTRTQHVKYCMVFKWCKYNTYTERRTTEESVCQRNADLGLCNYTTFYDDDEKRPEHGLKHRLEAVYFEAPCSLQSCLAFRILMKEGVFIIFNTPSPYKDSINDVTK